MYRRLVVPLMAVTALLALFAVVSPTGADGQSRGKDAVYANRDVVIRTPVLGTVQLYGGTLVLDEVIHGDLLVISGKVIFGGRGRVEGNLIHAGSTILGAEGRIGGRIYPLASLEGAVSALTKTAIIASLLLVWMVVAVVVTLMSGREIRISSIELRSSALHCFVLGLVAMTSFVLTAIAFSYLVPYVVGIPLLAALGVFGLLTKVYGMIAIFHTVGTLVAGSRTRQQLERRTWLRGDLAMVVVGVLLLGAIRLIPIVGTVLWSLASIFGIGVALATRFGRREPWFLAFRAANA
ncbi:MAG: hypothetical protein ABI779_14035 [Acidobacteriota bacterium]